MDIVSALFESPLHEPIETGVNVGLAPWNLLFGTSYGLGGYGYKGGKVIRNDEEASNDEVPAAKRNHVLFGTAAVIGGVAAAPVLYKAATASYKGKKKKRAEYIGMELNASADRAAMMIKAIAPVFAFPIAYIGVEELENTGYISGPLGDRVQTLLSVQAGSGILSDIIGAVT